jgi:hypothetical protein
MIWATGRGPMSGMGFSCPKHCEPCFDFFFAYRSSLKFRKGSKWQHEQGSELMFDSLVKENDIYLNEKDERFIKALIAGEPSRCEYVTSAD